MKGIDISNNDGSVNFQAVKDAGYEICYIKSTEGLTYDDPYTREFYNGAKAVGLKIGFYHFLRKNDPVQEAIHFLNAISGLNYDCIPMIDVEDDSLKDSTAKMRTKQFTEYCKSQGVQVGLYTYTSFLKESMDNDSLDLPLWIAEYDVSSPHISQSYVGFQYSEKGQVPGVSTNCDLDEFNEEIFTGQVQQRTWLQKGDTGDKVKQIQEILIQLGYDLGSCGADGDFGNLTYNALSDFQKCHNLPVNGCADGVTIDALNKRLQEKIEEDKKKTQYIADIPSGDNIFPILGKFYIEARADGNMGIHLDKGNYLVLKMGDEPEVYWNDNNGKLGSKKL